VANRSISAKLRSILAGKEGLDPNFELSKNQLAALAALGFRFYEQGSLRDAQTLFEWLTVLDPNLYFGHAGLGAMALRNEKLDDAVQHLKRAAELEAQDPAVYANLGEALLRQANFAEAATAFEQALKLDPVERNPSANRARAILQGMSAAARQVKGVSAA
jgi:tetratricopeptide (TPR) repeat protein